MFWVRRGQRIEAGGVVSSLSIECLTVAQVCSGAGRWSFCVGGTKKGAGPWQDLTPINCHAPLGERAISCRSGTNVRRPAHARPREGAIFREGSVSVASPNVGSLATVDLI